ncbi:hypothetical protein ACVW00_001410 [Marmoricola sp. URHA0025 HA25]
MPPETDATPRTKRELGAELQRTVIAARRAHFLSLADFATGHGLEIGPLDAGIADPDRHDVSYVDVFDTEGLRSHYAGDQNVIPELIPTIDFPLVQGGATRTLAEAAAAKAPYDWVIASHVIEHVPDYVGWLAEIAALTVDGGALILAVPDRRYSFDRHRPPTTVGQALEAHERRDARPSTRAVYDHFSSTVSVDTVALWRGDRPPAREPLAERLADVRGKVERARAGEYVDCHVWMFTPESFVQQLVELRILGLSDWYVETLLPVSHDLEFHVVLRRVPEGQKPEDYGFSEPKVDLDLPDWLHAEWATGRELTTLRRRLRKARKANQRLRSRVEALESSRRMRIGSALLAPFAAARRWVR